MLKDEINDRVILALNNIIEENVVSSKSALASILGTKPSKFSEILNGRMNAGTDIISIICTRYNVSPDWLLTGEGSMFVSSQLIQLADRLSDIISVIGLDSSAKAFQVSQYDIANFTNNLVLPERPFDYCNFLSIYPEYNYYWLLSGDGPQYKDEESETAVRMRGKCDTINQSIVAHPVDVKVRSEKAIPLIPSNAIAGYGSFDFQELPVENYYTVEELKDADFLIRVQGDSMYPKFSNGDIVACRKIDTITFWQWHKIYAICTRNQGILIKRVEEYRNNPAFITCRSENPAYSPFELHEDEIVSAALVLGAIILE